MRYLLLLCFDENAPELRDEPGRAARIEEYVTLGEEMRARGIWQAEARLRPSGTATSVRVREGEIVVSDGPFAETKEQVAGFYLVDCKDLDEAIELSARIPAARLGTVEVRPIWEM